MAVATSTMLGGPVWYDFMSLVINSYQTGRPSNVAVATAIEHLPTFLRLLAFGSR